MTNEYLWKYPHNRNGENIMNTPPRKVFIFGSGSTGKFVLHLVEEQYEVIGFIDNDNKRWGMFVDKYEISSPEKLINSDFDGVVIASLTGLNEITRQLLEMGISQDKIIKDFIETSIKSRIVFLEKLGEIFTEKSIAGSVAEGGVFRGEFACEINRVFPDKKLYLFDTFTGFDERDISIEKRNNYSEYGEAHLSTTSEELVLKKLPHADNVTICKGYFPETTKGIDDKFCFVNLDFDLYQPTFAGLEYFYPRMICGGIILIHDYFSEGYKGVKDAVKTFDRKVEGIKMFPIGDGISIGIYC
jgi:O-methyltransferase